MIVAVFCIVVVALILLDCYTQDWGQPKRAESKRFFWHLHIDSDGVRTLTDEGPRLAFVVLLLALLVVPASADRTEYRTVDYAHFSLLRVYPNSTATVYDVLQIAPPEECYIEPFVWVEMAELTELHLYAEQWFANCTLSNESLAIHLRFSEYDVQFGTYESVTLHPDLYTFPDESGHHSGYDALVSVQAENFCTEIVFVELSVYQAWNLTCEIQSRGMDYIHYEPSPIEILIGSTVLACLVVCWAWKRFVGKRGVTA